MASAITHFIAGAALALAALDSRAVRVVLPRWAIPVSSGALAVAPDFDTFAMRAFDIPYGSFLWPSRILPLAIVLDTVFGRARYNRGGPPFPAHRRLDGRDVGR